MNLVWRFNHQIILTKKKTNLMVSEGWRKHVTEVSGSGQLTLQGLSPDQEGLYICAVSDEDETMVTQTFLKRRAVP
ncbi:hypothetical protein ILYODFUR_034699 [Ilyodon furcidens]|uniref:Ig-like domain-containing protein n=1 Tax=Ilyodon furcidens TaxID=33524 RepID=A0ABV0U401_9TELE